MKKKYRIKEYVRRNGSRYFKVQEKFLLLWIPYRSNIYETYEEAQNVVDQIRAFEILESITHKVD